MQPLWLKKSVLCGLVEENITFCLPYSFLVCLMLAAVGEKVQILRGSDCCSVLKFVLFQQQQQLFTKAAPFFEVIGYFCI